MKCDEWLQYIKSAYVPCRCLGNGRNINSFHLEFICSSYVKYTDRYRKISVSVQHGMTLC